ncbi:MAG: helix-turn-helix domain-containing protein [Dermatophilaceae bacterium]
MSVAHSGDPAVGARLLTSPVRREIVDALANLEHGETGMSAAALAELLELHVTTVRFHLEQLVVAGILTVESRRGAGAGRPSKVYAVEPGRLEVGETEDAYRVLLELLAEAFASANAGTILTPEDAGRRWAKHRVDPGGPSSPATSPGAWLAKVGAMLDHLSDWGYSPEVATVDQGRTAEITLHKCPFLDLAHTNPQVVCGVHRGLIAGSMEQLGEDDLTVSLQPFTGPDTCLARLTTRTPFHRNVTRAQPTLSTQGPTS